MLAALKLGLYGLPGIVSLQVSVMGNLWQISVEESQNRSLGHWVGQGHTIVSEEFYASVETSPNMLLGPGRKRTLDHRVPHAIS